MRTIPSEGDRIEVIITPEEAANATRRSIIGRRGTVTSVHRGPWSFLSQDGKTTLRGLETLIYARIDGDDRLFNFLPYEVRRLSLLELIAEAAA